MQVLLLKTIVVGTYQNFNLISTGGAQSQEI
jgi:hypothetical protein